MFQEGKLANRLRCVELLICIGRSACVCAWETTIEKTATWLPLPLPLPLVIRLSPGAPGVRWYFWHRQRARVAQLEIRPASGAKYQPLTGTDLFAGSLAGSCSCAPANKAKPAPQDGESDANGTTTSTTTNSSQPFSQQTRDSQRASNDISASRCDNYAFRKNEKPRRRRRRLASERARGRALVFVWFIPAASKCIRSAVLLLEDTNPIRLKIPFRHFIKFSRSCRRRRRRRCCCCRFNQQPTSARKFPLVVPLLRTVTSVRRILVQGGGRS